MAFHLGLYPDFSMTMSINLIAALATRLPDAFCSELQAYGRLDNNSEVLRTCKLFQDGSNTA